MNSFTIQGDDVDVSKIMRTIQQRIEKKQRNGIYTDEELEEVTRLRLDTLADEIDIDAGLIEKLRSEQATWNISPDYALKSHRRGFGLIIVFLKKLVRPFIRLYTDHIVERQAQLNLYSVHILHNLVQEITLLQIENRKLKSRIDRLEKTQKFSNQRFKSPSKSSSMNNHRSGRKRKFEPKKS
jgi:hypothetical protein